MTAATIAALAAQEPPEPERGEQIMNASCAPACHDLRPIQTQALDRDGWSKVVNAEVMKGAMVAPDDVPVLVDYLAKSHGPLPEGPGKEVVLNICTMCHDLTRIRRNRATAEGWEEVLGNMLNEGAPLSDQDFEIVLNYLARNFGAPQ